MAKFSTPKKTKPVSAASGSGKKAGSGKAKSTKSAGKPPVRATAKAPRPSGKAATLKSVAKSTGKGSKKSAPVKLPSAKSTAPKKIAAGKSTLKKLASKHQDRTAAKGQKPAVLKPAVSKSPKGQKRVEPSVNKAGKKTASLAASGGSKPAAASPVMTAKNGKSAVAAPAVPISAKSADKKSGRPLNGSVTPAAGTRPGAGRDTNGLLKQGGHGERKSKKPDGKAELRPTAVATNLKPRKNQIGLTIRELEKFADLLLQKRREIVGDVSSMELEALRSGGSSNLSTLPVHMADMGTDNYEQEFTLGLVEKDRNLLREINNALGKIQDGSYGICEGTGLPISKPRLEFQPWARYSIEYARQKEKNGMGVRTIK